MSDDHTARLADHWWPRPGWRPGRLGYTWHITYENAPALHAAVDAQHRALERLPGLDLVPPRWLHSTVQGLGWADEVPDGQLAAGAAAVTRALAGVPAFEVAFGRPLVRREAILVRPEPAEPLHRLWRTVRDALAAATGPFPASDVFRPHVSTAYGAADADAAPYAAALAEVPAEPAAVRIAAVSLVRQERVLAPERLYRWETLLTAPLAP